MENQLHPDAEIDETFRRLQNQLVQWERITGRESILIFREAQGSLEEHGPQPSYVQLRWDNGLSIDPANSEKFNAKAPGREDAKKRGS